MFLVSHDRRFLDNVVTSTIAWEGDRPSRQTRAVARIRRRLRGLADAARAQPGGAAARRPRACRATGRRPLQQARRRNKLSYKEQRELDALPARIDALEAEQKSITEALADPALYARQPQRATELHARYAQIDDELLAALERWEALS